MRDGYLLVGAGLMAMGIGMLMMGLLIPGVLGLVAGAVVLGLGSR